jgi:cyclase
MLYKRIIAKLDIKSESVIKGIHMEGLRIVGKPNELSARYNDCGADEIIFIDTVASLYGRNHLKEFILQASEASYIPFTVGGGLRSVEEVEEMIKNGADKVAINTFAIENPEFIKELVEIFGSQAIVVSIHAKRIGDTWMAFKENGRENSGKNVLDWVDEATAMGAGELLVTSIDRDGTKKGFEESLYQQICARVNIPVIACGGAGNNNHIADLMLNTDCSGVALGSILHYNISSVEQIKSSLQDQKVLVRPNVDKMSV